MTIFRLFLLIFLLFTQLPGMAKPIAKEEALKLVTGRLGMIERFVSVYSVQDPGKADQSISGYKRLVLAGRGNLNLSENSDKTRYVYEDFQWSDYTEQKYPDYAPHHNIAFYDGEKTFHWSSENNSSLVTDRFNSVHVQTPPNVYMLFENWAHFNLMSMLNQLKEQKGITSDTFKVQFENSDYLIDVIGAVGPLTFEILFDPQKGMKRLKTKPRDMGTVVVDDFQEVKDGVWFPKRGRVVFSGKTEREVKIEVLKVKVNEDINPALFKNFPWDDPKYNTKFGLKWEGDNQRRTNRILFNDHPPSYFTSFFGISLEEAYQMYLQID